MLINLSNHPSPRWSETQKRAASVYGDIVDLPFPVVDAQGDEEYISMIADEYVRKVEEKSNGCTLFVHLMGEMSLTFALIKRLHEKGISCVASTSERKVVEYEPGRKEVIFQFVRFRQYM